MAFVVHTSAIPYKQYPFQIIQYTGPPKPKQTSRGNPLKAPPSHDSPRSDAELDGRESPVPTSSSVEVIDLTCLVGESTSEIRGIRGEGEGDVGSYADFAPKIEFEDEDIERTFRDGIEHESSNWLAMYENSCRGHTVDIENSQPRSDTDEGDLHEDHAGTQTGDRREASSISALECCGQACPATTGSVIYQDAGDEVKTRMSEPPSRKLPLKPPTSTSQVDIGRSSRGRVPTNEDTSRSSISSSDTDNSDKNDHVNQTAPLTCKRKRCPSITRHIQSSGMTSKQYSKKDTRSKKQRKRSIAGGNPLSDRPLAQTHRQAPPYSGHDAKECYSDDRSDDSIEDHVRHLKSEERPTLHVPISRSRKHKLKRNGGAGYKDDEYEVERILNARSSRKKLQYRVKWLGYKDDPIWYDASNFKNSPHKVRDFHLLNPTRPGPPKRLKRWIQCWEDDSDTDDHPDDNKTV